MPYLSSLYGLKLLKKYVKNWPDVLLALVNLYETEAKFIDGTQVMITKTDHTSFFEKIYRLYLTDIGYKFIKDNGKQCVLLPNGFKLLIPPTNRPSLKYLDEVFEMKIYGDQSLDGRVVIDVGSYIGDSCLYFIQQGAYLVYAFEIDREYFEILQRNIEMNDLQNKIISYNIGVTSKFLTRFIEGYRLKDIFLKIDCDGCEYELLMNLPDQIYFNYIKDIVVECYPVKQFIKKFQSVGYDTHFIRGIKGIKEGIVYATKRDN